MEINTNDVEIFVSGYCVNRKRLFLFVTILWPLWI